MDVGPALQEIRARVGQDQAPAGQSSAMLLEAAYQYLLEHPPLGLAVQRQGDELFLVWAPQVAKSIELHLGSPRPRPLSRAGTEVLALVAYKQPITRTGVDHLRGTTSDSALDTLLVRGLVIFDEHHLLVTTHMFLRRTGPRDLADLPQLLDIDAEELRGELVEAAVSQDAGDAFGRGTLLAEASRSAMRLEHPCSAVVNSGCLTAA